MPGVIGLYVLKRVEVRDRAALTSVGRCSKFNSVEYFLRNTVERVGERMRSDEGEIRRDLKRATTERAKAMSWREEPLASLRCKLHNHTTSATPKHELLQISTNCEKVDLGRPLQRIMDRTSPNKNADIELGSFFQDPGGSERVEGQGKGGRLQIVGDCKRVGEIGAEAKMLMHVVMY